MAGRLNPHNPHRNHGRNRKKRSRTFLKEDAAKAYAEKQGLKNYKILKNELSKNKKFRIVSE